MERKSAFERWAEGEGIPIIRAYYVEDLLGVEVRPWERKGGLGALIILEGGQGWNFAYVCEIPSGARLKPQRHLFEEQIYVLRGRGESEFWNDGGSTVSSTLSAQTEGSSPSNGKRQKISWQAGSLFATPLNAWHDYHNTGMEPARYVAVSNAPVVLNLFNDPEAVFGCSFNFLERYSGEADYFNPEGKQDKEIGVGTDRPRWRVNFIPDIYASKLGETPMGTGMSLVQLNLSGNSMAAHLAELEVGTYKKAHRHQAAAHIVWLSGRGYTLLWSEKGERMRIDWKKHSLVSPPQNWYHQHFNVSPEPARHVALRRGLFGVGIMHKPWLDVKLGGDQIEYEDEDADVRQIYEEELKKVGIPCRMPPVHR